MRGQVSRRAGRRAVVSRSVGMNIRCEKVGRECYAGCLPISMDQLMHQHMGRPLTLLCSVSAGRWN